MFAVVEILGQQFKVEKNQKIIVNKLNEKEGSKISFSNVLLVDNGKDFSLGTPTVSNYSVDAKITKHLKGEKVIVFKKKRRKGYRVKNGHKQHLSEIIIESISQTSGLVKKTNDKTKKSNESKPKKVKANLSENKPNFKAKTLSELKEIAKDKKISGYSSMKKDDLIKKISSLN